MLAILLSIMASIVFCNCTYYYALNLSFSAALLFHSVLKKINFRIVELGITESFRLGKTFKIIESSHKPNLDQCFTLIAKS